MASTKISALPGASTLTGAETIPLVQGGVTKKVTTDQFLTKDASGNVGLGVTPSAWNSAFDVVQMGAGTALTNPSSITQTWLSSNAFYDTGWKYMHSAESSYYQQSLGSHSWYTAPSGTAGNPISFTQAMTLDASGNLGLGVTPSAWHTNFKALQIGTFGSISTNALHTSATAIANMAYASGEYTWTYTTTGLAAARYEQLLGSHTWFTAPSGTAGNPISFTQAMTLNASGALGIGTAAPSNTLHVVAAGDNSVIRVGSSTAGRAEWFAQAITGTAITGSLGAYPYAIWTNGAERARIDASGNLLVGLTSAIAGERLGVTSASNGIRVNTTAATSTSLTCSANTSNLFIEHDATSSAKIRSGAGGINFATSGASAAMALDVSGNLLVGATTASGKLHVTNANNVSGDTAAYLAMGSNTNNASSYFFQCVTSGVGAKAYILGNGNLQNANNSYGAFSDVKLKENITDASPKLSKLMQVRIVNYNLKSDPDKTKLIGVVAQELEQVSPGLIEETADRDAEGNDLGTTTKSVKYSVFIPMLIKSLQEQQAQIEALEARLAAAGI